MWKQPYTTDLILMDEKGERIHAVVKKLAIWFRFVLFPDILNKKVTGAADVDGKLGQSGLPIYDITISSSWKRISEKRTKTKPKQQNRARECEERCHIPKFHCIGRLDLGL
ncbi:hypothetical protein Tco_0316304 [Tanacetum coccineum]